MNTSREESAKSRSTSAIHSTPVCRAPENVRTTVTSRLLLKAFPKMSHHEKPEDRISVSIYACCIRRESHLKLFSYALAGGNVIIGFCVEMCSDRISINVAICG